MLQYKGNGKTAVFPWFCKIEFERIIPVEGDGTKELPLPPVPFNFSNIILFYEE